jgi:predicted RNA-binding protein with PIN domain
MNRTESTFIVDGYNLMRQAVGTPEALGGLARAREALERLLLAFAGPPSSTRRVVLVYDGESAAGTHASRGGGGGGETSRLEIRFARPPRSADDVVIDLAHALEGRGELHVVSSDMQDIGRRVAGLKLRLWSSREFAELLHDGGPRRAPSGSEDKPSRIGSAEVESWVNRFGFGDDPPPRNPRSPDSTRKPVPGAGE